MTIAFSAVLANYNELRYSVIRNLEEPGGVPHLSVYVDSVGIATIGAGFNVHAWPQQILEEMPCWGQLTVQQQVDAVKAVDRKHKTEDTSGEHHP